MRKKMIAVCLLTGILLTGCGAPDVVLEEAKSVSSDFISSEEELNQAIDQIASGGKESEPVTISVIKREQLKRLQELITKDEFIKKKYYLEDEGDSDETEMDEDILSEWVQFEVGTKNTAAIFDEDMCLTFDDIKLKDGELDKFMEKMEALGYKNMKGMTPDDSRYLVRQGIEFYIFKPQHENSCYVGVTIPAARYCYPKKYEKLIEQNIGDGFCLSDVATGGYMDCLEMTSSWNEPGNPYNKKVFLYLKEDKALQLEVKIVENVDKAEGPVFSSYEQQTIINLLTMMSGNQTAAASFVANFRLDGDTEGEIGDKTWNLVKDRKNEYDILRVQ